MDADKLGIDCPLGWPDDFLLFPQEHHSGHVGAPQEVAGRDWRRKLAYRATDRAVRERTGLSPLSVAAARIGHSSLGPVTMDSNLGWGHQGSSPSNSSEFSGPPVSQNFSTRSAATQAPCAQNFS
jgi:hypothetical protein